MKRTFITIFIVAGLMYSCKQNPSGALLGKWKATKLENPFEDSVFKAGQGFIDTMGKNHDDATNIQLYGTANMDSLRKEMQKQHDEAKQTQDSAVRNTVFNFRKDGIAIITFGGQLDSNKWTMDNENNIIIESLDQADNGQVLKWRIAELTANEMKLVFKQKQDSTMVTFRR